MPIKKFQPEGKGIMLETRFTEFPTLSVDPKVGISRSASETNVWLYFLPMTLKFSKSFISFIYDILCRITTFYEIRIFRGS